MFTIWGLLLLTIYFKYFLGPSSGDFANVSNFEKIEKRYN